jgi:hypothetical protein
MRWSSAATAGVSIAMAAVGVLAQQLPFEPAHESGQSITGAFEGWFANPDGSVSLLAGYYNRNSKQEFDIPAGPNNRIEPGGPDQGQPTHFLPGRQWGVFTVTVPKDFGDKKLTWTLIANGKSTVIPMSLNPLWEVAPFRDASGNTPPFIGFADTGPLVQGPRGQTTSLRATVADPLVLAVWVADDALSPLVGRQPGTSPVTIEWSKFRGPGAVQFGNARPPVEKLDFSAPPSTMFRGKATTAAKFSEPGEYLLRVVANDWSGDGGSGFQCCWTNAYARVSVK